MTMGAGVLLMASGFWVMAQAAKTIAKSGKGTIAVFAGMAVAIGLLGIGLAYYQRTWLK